MGTVSVTTPTVHHHHSSHHHHKSHHGSHHHHSSHHHHHSSGMNETIGIGFGGDGMNVTFGVPVTEERPYDQQVMMSDYGKNCEDERIVEWLMERVV